MNRRTVSIFIMALFLSGSLAAEDGKPYIRILYPDNLSSLSWGDLIEFTGRVSPDCQAITVYYYGAGDKPRESYSLQKFRPGVSDFLYRAGKHLGNLALGANRFVFEASFKDGGVLRDETLLYVYEAQHD